MSSARSCTRTRCQLTNKQTFLFKNSTFSKRASRYIFSPSPIYGVTNFTHVGTDVSEMLSVRTKCRFLMFQCCARISASWEQWLKMCGQMILRLATFCGAAELFVGITWGRRGCREQDGYKEKDWWNEKKDGEIKVE